jgi:RNA polymerase sigma factor (sigma-70 family)
LSGFQFGAAYNADQMILDDEELLRLYAAERSQDAFGELVRRYLPLVFSAAVRRLNGDVHRAADVSQIVFAAVAKDASRLSRHPVLAGWLHTATCHAAIDLVRAEKRRFVREQKAHSMQEIPDSPDPASGDWPKLRPIIDEVLDDLPKSDREAVLLRFFQAQPFPEIGRKLGVGEDAARKRVERALEALRQVLTRRGISSTSIALATILSSETIVAAPAGLSASIVGSAWVGSASVGSMVFMTVTKIQTGILAAAFLGGAAGLIWQQHALTQLQIAQSTAQNEADKTAAENVRLTKARASAEADAALLRTQLASLRKKSEVRESSGVTSAIPSGPASASPAIAAVPRDPQQLPKLHQRYDPFLKQRGFTPADMDRWVELMMEKDNVRDDLQAAMREHGVAGGSDEVEALRSKLTDPLWDEMKAMLGREGFAAFNDYEQMSAYRGYLDPLSPRLSAANATLSDQQADQLIRTIIANNHPQRMSPTDLGTNSHIDWTSVTQQANNFLTPTQLSILNDFLQHGGGR